MGLVIGVTSAKQGDIDLTTARTRGGKLRTATNPKTGDHAVFDNGEWKPLRTATNPETGEHAVLIGGAWEPLVSDVDAADVEAPSFGMGGQIADMEPEPSSAFTESETPEQVMMGADPLRNETAGGLLKRRGQQFTQGAAEVAAAIPEAILAGGERATQKRELNLAPEVIAWRMEEIAELEQALANPDLTPEVRAHIEGQLAEKRQTVAAFEARQAEGLADRTQQPSYALGDQVRAWRSEKFGDPDPLDQSFWGKLAQGAGSMAAFMTTALLPGGLFTTATAGAAVNEAQVYREAKAAGLAEDEALGASRLAALLGTTEAVPIIRALDYLPKSLRGKVTGELNKRLLKVLQAGGEEAAQEGLVGVGNNLIASGYYDPERGWADDVPEQMLIGAILGFGSGGLGQVVDPVRNRPPAVTTGNVEVDDAVQQIVDIVNATVAPGTPEIVETPAPQQVDGSGSPEAGALPVSDPPPQDTAMPEPSPAEETSPEPSSIVPDATEEAGPAEAPSGPETSGSLEDGGDFAPVPFNEFLAALPEDSDGYNDLEVGSQAIEAVKGERVPWNELTPAEQASVMDRLTDGEYQPAPAESTPDQPESAPEEGPIAPESTPDPQKTAQEPETAPSAPDDTGQTVEPAPAPAQAAKPKTAKLRSTAETAIRKAEEAMGADRQTNTARRARMAGNAIADAEAKALRGKTALAVADAIEADPSSPLATVTSLKDIERLESQLRQGRYARQRSEGLDYGQQQKEKGQPFGAADIDMVPPPRVLARSAGMSELLGFIKGRRGYDRAALQSIQRRDGQIAGNDIETLEAALKVARKKGGTLPWGVKDLATEVREYHALKKLFGDNDRAILTAFNDVRNEAKGTTPKKVVRPTEKARQDLQFQKLPGFFETPAVVAERMVEMSGLKPGDTVLEPSAGLGRIADAAADVVGKENVDVIERNNTMGAALQEDGYRLVDVDIMEFDGGPGTKAPYDVILMNPPFEKGQDADHVRKAYDLLKPGGTLVAITGEGIHFRGDKKAAGFREWLEGLDGVTEKLPEGTFKESGTGVNSRLVTIEKPQGEEPTADNAGDPKVTLDELREDYLREWQAREDLADTPENQQLFEGMTAKLREIRETIKRRFGQKAADDVLNSTEQVIFQEDNQEASPREQAIAREKDQASPPIEPRATGDELGNMTALEAFNAAMEYIPRNRAEGGMARGYNWSFDQFWGKNRVKQPKGKLFITPDNALDAYYFSTAELEKLKAKAEAGEPGPVARTGKPDPVAELVEAGRVQDLTPSNDVAKVKPIEEAAADVDTNPSEAQKEAGNYKKGHTKVRGFDITIENPKGSERSGTSPDGSAWSVTMPAHYGYIKRTVGKDGDHVDVYLADNPETGGIYVIDQQNPETGIFDEHKLVIGADNQEAALELYYRGFSDGLGPDRVQAITPISDQRLFEAINVAEPWRLPWHKQEARAAQALDGPSVEQLREALGDDPDGKAEGRISRKASDGSVSRFGQLSAAQRIDAGTLIQIKDLPNQPTKPKKRRITRPKKKSNVTRAQKQEAQAKALEQLDDAGAELKAQLKLKSKDRQAAPITVTLESASGARTKFTFPKSQAGLERLQLVRKEWAGPVSSKHELDTLSNGVQVPSDISPLSTPMPNHQPLYQELMAPVRPGSNAITIAGEVIPLPPERRPMRRERLKLDFETAMDRRVYKGKVKGKTVAGYYNRKHGSIRLKRFDDIEVLAHEFAHWLDFNSTLNGSFNRMRKFAPKKAREQMKSLSYTDAKDKVNSEGFAEFVRLWFTQYERAETLAPDFLKEFNTELDRHPKLKKQMLALRKNAHIYYLQGSLAQFRSKQGEDTSIAMATKRYMSQRPKEMARQQFVDALHGFKVAERETLDNELPTAARSAYKQMQMVNGVGSVYDMIIEDGTIRLGDDGSFHRRGKGLKEIFQPVARLGGKAIDDFMSYAAARRAAELMAQGRENLFSPSDIAAGMELERPEFKRAFAEYQTFNKHMLEFYVQMGLITTEQKDAFQEANQEYIPFYRVSHGLETGSTAGTAPSILRRLTGGDRNVRNLLENVTHGLHANLKAAMVARAKRTLYENLQKNDLGGRFAVKLAPDSKKVRVAQQSMADNVASIMAELGLGVSQGGMIVANPSSKTITDVDSISTVLENNPDLLNMWQHNQRPKTQETYVDMVVIDDKPVYFEVTDPVLYESLQSQQFFDAGWGWRHIITPVVKVRRFISSAITSLPPFFLPNFFRDTVTAAILSDSGFRPGYESVKGAGHIIKGAALNDETFKAWRRNGGGYSALVKQAQRERGPAALGFHKTDPLHLMARGITALESGAALFENGTRVGEYKRAIDQGETPIEAAWRAREVSTDFAKQAGAHWWSTLLSTIPFANAALQGNDRLWRGYVGDGKNVFSKSSAAAFAARFTAKNSIAIMMFSAALWMHNRDDERYQRLTKDEKGRFWHFWLPGDDRSYRVPKPYGVGFIAADFIEQTLEKIGGTQGDDVAANLAWSMMHHFWFMDYPGIAQPFIDVKLNRTFTGAPVVPDWMLDASPQYQFRSNTPEIYKLMGEHLGFSPLKTQHYARGFLGYIETAVSHLSETMLWDPDRHGEQPFPKTIEGYALKQFRASPFPFRSKYTERFYDLRARARTAAVNESIMKKQAYRDIDAYRDLVGDPEHRLLKGMNKDFTKIGKTLTRMRDLVDWIKYDPKKTRAEKEAEIEKMYRDRDKFLRKSYARVEAAVAAMEAQLQP